MAEVGVNPNEAAAAGASTSAAAEGFKGLAESFRTMVGIAEKASGKDPGVDGGYAPFGEKWVSALTEVEHHGVSVGDNTVGGAGKGVQTDTKIATQVAAAGSSIKPINI
ncbi:hypothetical protein Afil01_13010 [Actinorhabdospora filicis]|uniref:Uncharacterized protein n=1 Tax=Actinorhabdospora filicis TaxID=1785913 RepID=A0A9W6SJ40_9ACTN|nr:hypothetical protein [Actinorhabdospora filicis]GLZ76494.1 hypothetical protein Afil01_13010 [Actinorhabdospora filicis]